MTIDLKNYRAKSMRCYRVDNNQSRVVAYLGDLQAKVNARRQLQSHKLCNATIFVRTSVPAIVI